MTRLILLTILITVVYAWPETKHALKSILLRIFGRSNKSGPIVRDHVGLLVMLLTFPASLMVVVAHAEDLQKQMWLISLQLLLVFLIAAGLTICIKRLQWLRGAGNDEKLILISYAVAGLVTPAFKVAAGSDRESRMIGKFALALSIPSLVALGLKFANDHVSPNELLPNMDLLIWIMFGAAIIHVSINFLETHLRLYRLRRITSYYRVVLGIVLTLILLY